MSDLCNNTFLNTSSYYGTKDAQKEKEKEKEIVQLVTIFDMAKKEISTGREAVWTPWRVWATIAVSLTA